MGNVSKHVEILRKNQIEVLLIQSTVAEMKNAFDGRPDMAKGRLSELDGMSTESSKTEKQREQRLKKQNGISKDCCTTKKGVTYLLLWDYQEKKERKIYLNIKMIRDCQEWGMGKRDD